MKCSILHESSGRMRVHLHCGRMTLRQADVLEYYLKNEPGVLDVTVFDRTQDAVIRYRQDRSGVIGALARFSFAGAEKLDLVPDHTARAINREFEEKLIFTLCRRACNRLFLPLPVAAAIAAVKSLKYIKEGLKALLHGKLTVAVLDATAVTVSMVRGDFDTAGSVMFMLRLGEILEEWTHKKSVADLAGAMALQVENVWLKTGETEVLVPVGQVRVGDQIVIRTGSLIPLDGKVLSGEAMVNQSSMTGESQPVVKGPGSFVYAGTVAEEGECVVQVEKAMGSGRYDRIVKMIEDSEKLKSSATVQRLPSGGQVGSLHPGRYGSDLPHYPECNENACRSDGGLLLRAEAGYAHCGSQCHAGKRPVPHLCQRRPVPGEYGQGGYHCFR